jgi:hypothetical protein
MATAPEQQPEGYGTAFDQFTEDLQRNPSLQAAVRDIEPQEGGNLVGLVDVAHAFGHDITVEEVDAYKQGMDRRVKNDQYLGTLLG